MRSADQLVRGHGTARQLVALDLARRAARYLGVRDHLGVARPLEAGQAARAPRADLVERQRRARLEHDDDLDRLAPALVGHADRAGLADGGVGGDDLLDLRRVDVLTAG